MKVLHFIKSTVGGSWAFRQTRELVRLGVEIHAMLPTSGPLKEAYIDAGVCVHDGQPSLDTRRPDQWTAQRAAMRSIVDQVQPDLIHSHYVGTTLGMRAFLGRNHHIPRVFQVPGPLHLEHPFFRRAEIASAGKADYWVGSCQWTCDRYLASGVLPERVFLSYYGTDLETIRCHPPGYLREELGLGPETKIVGMVAYMYAPKRYLGQQRGLKGHEDLIDAVRIVRETNQNVVLVMVGGAWNNAHDYEQKVRAYGGKRLGRAAIFLGTRPDVPRLYADFDVAAHPSHSENVGGAAESLLLGVPTVATSVGGFPDVVRHGETGWLVPPKDPVALAAALLDALDHPSKAQSLAEAGQQFIRPLFDVRRTAAEVANIYRAVLENHSGA